MIKKRLLQIVPESKKYIGANVVIQWISLVTNIVMIYEIATFLEKLFLDDFTDDDIMRVAVVMIIALVIKAICTIGSSKMSFQSSKTVKLKMREMIYSKLLRLGASYKNDVNTSEIVQMTVEGVDQLETYFGAYLPQFFYAFLAPITLFIVMCFVNIPAAVILLICVPLIPGAIMMVQKWAKKLLAKYWGQYTNMGNTFLENLQGLTTLKIYQSDDFKHEEMKKESEKFRVVTMKVLTMQLNSIIIMDFIAYGGAALGIIVGALQFDNGSVDLAGMLMIILLAADFFLPMRRLGSYFHVAMNGMAASDKIFALLDLPEPEQKTEQFPDITDIKVDNLHYSYDDREVVHGVNMEFANGSFTSIVGESGCGKSTIASVLMRRNKNYSGSVTIGGKEISDINEGCLLDDITYINHQSYLFKGTVRDNLMLGKIDANDDEMWDVLEKVNLAAFLKNENGLDTMINESATNLSGGQRQRLALARALLHDSKVYIFDEATSNIDIESEADIMTRINEIAKDHTVILISHRLANVTNSDNIYVMEAGEIKEQGTHADLLSKDGIYSRLWNTQMALENYGVDVA